MESVLHGVSVVNGSGGPIRFGSGVVDRPGGSWRLPNRPPRGRRFEHARTNGTAKANGNGLGKAVEYRDNERARAWQHFRERRRFIHSSRETEPPTNAAKISSLERDTGRAPD